MQVLAVGHSTITYYTNKSQSDSGRVAPNSSLYSIAIGWKCVEVHTKPAFSLCPYTLREGGSFIFPIYTSAPLPPSLALTLWILKISVSPKERMLTNALHLLKLPK